MFDCKQLESSQMINVAVKIHPLDLANIELVVITTDLNAEEGAMLSHTLYHSKSSKIHWKII